MLLYKPVRIYTNQIVDRITVKYLKKLDEDKDDD